MNGWQEALAAAGPISHDEAEEMLSRYNASHFRSDKPRARYSIPRNPRYDDDIRMSAYIEQQRAKDAELARLREMEKAVIAAKLLDESGKVRRWCGDPIFLATGEIMGYGGTCYLPPHDRRSRVPRKKVNHCAWFERCFTDPKMAAEFWNDRERHREAAKREATPLSADGHPLTPGTRCYMSTGLVEGEERVTACVVLFVGHAEEPGQARVIHLLTEDGIEFAASAESVYASEEAASKNSA